MTSRRVFPESLLLAGGLVLTLAASAPAHFPILLPDSPAGLPGEPMRIRLLFGHPFEHELQPVDPPRTVTAHPPVGEPVILAEHAAGAAPRSGADSSAGSPPPAKEEPASAGEVRCRSFLYRPDERGDHIVTVEARPVVRENDEVVLEDHAKVILHVLSQNGWDRAVGLPLEIVPLTRPYGLRPGWCFQGRVLLHGSPVEGAEIEVERYNSSPPSGPLPEDEFVTRTCRTDAGGGLTTTLDEEGWWGIAVEVPRGRAVGPDGKERPRVLRSVLWVYVGEPLRSSE